MQLSDGGVGKPPNPPTSKSGVSSNATIRYDRNVWLMVLIHHKRRIIRGCGCGWTQLGASHAEHVVNMYEEIILSRDL